MWHRRYSSSWWTGTTGWRIRTKVVHRQSSRSRKSACSIWQELVILSKLFLCYHNQESWFLHLAILSGQKIYRTGLEDAKNDSYLRKTAWRKIRRSKKHYIERRKNKIRKATCRTYFNSQQEANLQPLVVADSGLRIKHNILCFQLGFWLG